MNFRARGFEREIWGGNRGFVYIGLKLFWFEKRTSYQQRPGGKVAGGGSTMKSNIQALTSKQLL